MKVKRYQIDFTTPLVQLLIATFRKIQQALTTTFRISPLITMFLYYQLIYVCLLAGYTAMLSYVLTVMCFDSSVLKFEIKMKSEYFN